MNQNKNRRETGARTLPARKDADTMDEFSQDAAANRPSRGIDNSEPVDDAERKTRHLDGTDLKRPAHVSPQQKSGAGPALARHSKDADKPQTRRGK